jgi:hypothetical protein
MSEQGHAKNLEHFTTGRNYAVSWGAKYAPSNPLLALTFMNAKIAAAESVADELQETRTPYRNATAAAQDAFAPLSELITRVMRALKVSGVPASFIEDAKTYARKIQGRRAAPAAQDDPNTPDVDESAASHSASQMSRTQRTEALDALNLHLESNTLYKPNETPLKLATLKSVSIDLKGKTEAVQTTFVPYSNKLGERDEIYYEEAEGIVTIGSLFKDYVLAAFGRDSAEWNQVKDLKFKTYKRR